ncbi:hypothetical protein Thiofri_01380 [Thiorhodovibrio frisius]|nr:hypothetical protein Thiofri_01380 [Thiorhodovibrio frisius]
MIVKKRNLTVRLNCAINQTRRLLVFPLLIKRETEKMERVRVVWSLIQQFLVTSYRSRKISPAVFCHRII